jgi:hypothetical protein
LAPPGGKPGNFVRMSARDTSLLSGEPGEPPPVGYRRHVPSPPFSLRGVNSRHVRSVSRVPPSRGCFQLGAYRSIESDSKRCFRSFAAHASAIEVFRRHIGRPAKAKWLGSGMRRDVLRARRFSHGRADLLSHDLVREDPGGGGNLSFTIPVRFTYTIVPT